MGLLADIQTSLLNEQPIGPILLKLRFLAARLNSDALAEWVKHESEGYPAGAPVPDYRKFGISYTGSFNGAFGRSVSNIAIPPYLISQVAGDSWLSHHERQSVSAIEDLIATAEKNNSSLGINASNLVMVLSDKVFEGMFCHSVKANISRASMVEMVGALRARVLELTLELEKNVPGAMEIAAGQSTQGAEPEKSAVVANIINQIVNGPVGSNVANSGDGAQFNITVQQNDAESLARALKAGGIAEADADEFTALVASETPEAADQPFGTKAKAWIAANIGKALNGAWKVGAPVATALLADAAKKFYGLG